MRKYIPNALTILRILLVPLFLYAMFLYPREMAAPYSLFFFVLASLTDYIDGSLARAWNVVSNFGKIMDPLADKLLVLSALAGLCWLPPFSLSPIIFFVILIRELGITILREVYLRRGIVVAAGNLGKLKTVMQMAGIIFALACWTFLPRISSGLKLGVSLWFWLVACITVISGLNYIKAMFPGRKDA
ncbi:MAG: CDP-diacylglycerol--glycerol-3-phosphate 3-phosphatidyltransferase [Candidatus Cloacimonadaceae bacterium]|jgi:CDP-diacylglycerol--glycerol-3-phosphate 3-phosphatidyltransferase|nr:CDP-diacylglycerol--glycerol-3-phosphate 3-phosphatidyltransferase [Candidatus Cloacimonadota bacterium]MDY0127836.1 CDP-diacylglycerol--glycerol-3-phosphate 3-phosphatidyltransferase [Candidatus Cloacimonadaceae bacterium]MCB5254084.1 CDP-diacylglycerol--glycerol-3-phosphate 3-phosphatidyltransferase [Candidatus Cloacimonadota bacterium]MCK9178204.1 CDP-diacylglycerol--glycerol-3-phosphate 3-phosphatidyltransferase [Candidatus Cloacimonadota bacterium]MCK9242602.1 CDP-diacylglycerol--glycer